MFAKRRPVRASQQNTVERVGAGCILPAFPAKIRLTGT